MPSKQERGLVFEYWFRVFIGLDITIEDITKIASEFGDEYEMFDAMLSDPDYKIENGKLAYKLSKNVEDDDRSVFGTLIAVSGCLYHWKIKIVGNKFINIGIIEAEKCLQYQKQMWWTRVGISYYANDGDIYQYDKDTKECESHQYGEEFAHEREVIIDIWLDMRDNYELSFAKNEIQFGKAADVEKSKNYRLAVAFWSKDTTVELITGDVQYK